MVKTPKASPVNIENSSQGKLMDPAWARRELCRKGHRREMALRILVVRGKWRGSSLMEIECEYNAISVRYA